MRALSLGEPVTWPANELIRVASRPKVVNIGNENTFAHDIAWMRLIAEVGREAKNAAVRSRSSRRVVRSCPKPGRR